MKCPMGSKTSDLLVDWSQSSTPIEFPRKHARSTFLDATFCHKSASVEDSAAFVLTLWGDCDHRVICHDAQFLTRHKPKCSKPFSIQSDAWNNALVFRVLLSPFSIQL